MKKHFILYMFLIVILTACGGNGTKTTDSESNTEVQEEEFTLRMHSSGTQNHPFVLGAEYFKELIEEKTDGSITIEIHPNNSLASGAQAIESVQLGTIDIALESTMTLSNFVPDFNVLNLPFLFKNINDVYNVIDGDVGKDLAQKSEDKGFKILSYWDNGFRQISNSIHPIESPKDLQGLKIRVPESEVFITTFKALGAIPTALSGGEVFSALQLGTIDGQENPNSNFFEHQLYEAQDHLAITNHIYTAQPLIINIDLFNQMSEGQKNALLEAANEAGEYQRQLSQEQADDYLEEIKAKGVKVTTPDIKPFQDAVETVYEQYQNEFGTYLDRILTID